MNILKLCYLQLSQQEKHMFRPQIFLHFPLRCKFRNHIFRGNILPGFLGVEIERSVLSVDNSAPRKPGTEACQSRILFIWQQAAP